MAFCGQCGTKSSGGSFCTECGAKISTSKETSTKASAPTPFLTRCDILAELWIGYKNDEEFFDFIEQNDLGLPLAYAVSTLIVESNPKVETFVNETFDNLLESFSLEDAAYESLSQLLGEEDDDELEEED